MMKTPMGVAAKNLTASDDESLMPDPVNAWTRPEGASGERPVSGISVLRQRRSGGIQTVALRQIARQIPQEVQTRFQHPSPISPHFYLRVRANDSHVLQIIGGESEPPRLGLVMAATGIDHLQFAACDHPFAGCHDGSA